MSSAFLPPTASPFFSASIFLPLLFDIDIVIDIVIVVIVMDE